MTTFLAAAGPLVWPTLLLTGVTLWFSAAYARSGRPRFAWTAASLAVATLLMAGLAAVTGFQRSVAAAGAAQLQDRWVVVLGLAESLNGLVLALFACVAASVIVAYGATRVGPRPPRRDRPGSQASSSGALRLKEDSRCANPRRAAEFGD